MIDFASLPWGDILKGGASIFGAMQGSKNAQNAAQQATPTPWSVFGPAGNFLSQNGQINMQMADNPFARMFNSLGGSSLANAATAPGQFLFGASPELAEAYKGMFGQGLTDRIQDNLGLLRSAAAPQENRDSLALDTNLFSMGQLGTTGGAERFRALQEAFGQNDLNRQISAIGLGRQEASDRFTSALNATSQGMSAANQGFNMGIGSFNSIQHLFQNLLNQGQLGISAGQAGAMPAGLAPWLAQQNGNPFQAGFNFLNQGGLFDWMNGTPGAGRGPPVVPQPTGGPVQVTPPFKFPMPQVPGFN